MFKVNDLWPHENELYPTPNPQCAPNPDHLFRKCWHPHTCIIPKIGPYFDYILGYYHRRWHIHAIYIFNCNITYYIILTQSVSGFLSMWLIPCYSLYSAVTGASDYQWVQTSGHQTHTRLVLPSFTISICFHNKIC